MYESSYREPPPYERAYHLSYQSSYILVLVPLVAYEKSFGRYENVGKSIFCIMVWYREVYSVVDPNEVTACVSSLFIDF